MSPDKIYKIEELALDGRALLGQKHRITFYRVTRAAIWIAFLYFTTRLYFLLRSPEPTWKMWTMFAIECLFSHMSYQHQALSLSAAASPSHLSRRRLRLHDGPSMPTVDVLITCCGESTDIILNTVAAACLLDYPTSRFRVRLLDDGASTELRDQISKLSVKWSHLSYHTRGKQSNQSFAKAGNLNYALFSLQTEDPPQFCTVVDADSILLPHFLRATLPHLLEDPQAALLTTRQYFDNLPRGDPLSQSRAYFYNCENAELDLINHAVDAGSGAVFRRDAIIEVGGYPTFSFSEDWQLSLILRGMDKHTVQVQEVLQFGLVPTSLAGHVKQRNRWHIGHSQQISVLFVPAKPPIPRHLSWGIAAGGLSIMASLATSYWLVCMSYLHGDTIGPGVNMLAFLSFLSHTQKTAGLLLFHLFGSKPKGSFVTGSAANCSEDVPSTKPGAMLNRDILAGGLWLNLCLLIAIWAGILISAQALVGANGRLIETLVTTAFWPPFVILTLSAISNNWVPIQHMLNAPVYQPRASPRVAIEDEPSSLNEDLTGLSRGPSIIGRSCAIGLPMIIIGLSMAILAL
ncbi:unnamed protein product [Penicillium bialowiezense]